MSGFTGLSNKIHSNMKVLSLEVCHWYYLQNTHAIGVSQDLVRFIVVTVSDVGCSNEKLKRIILVQVQRACFDLLLQLSHPLLSITRKQQIHFYQGSHNFTYSTQFEPIE